MSTNPLTPAPPRLPPPPNPALFINVYTAPLPSEALSLIAPVTTFYILALVAIGLRIWSKKIKKASLRFNDYAIFVAAVFATGYLSICWLVVERGGVGHPLFQVPLVPRKLTQQSFIVAWLIQAWGNTFVRLSILDFFAHVFRVSRFLIVVHIFEALTVMYLVGCTITWFAICRPLRYNWEIGPTTAQHCGNLNLKFLLSSIFNLVLDVSILILPMPMLWTLQLNSRKKVALTIVFGLGVFVCFATAWRTYNVIEFSKPSSKLNFTVTVIHDALWSGLEITLGIINACMPVMQPALQKIFNGPFTRLMALNTWRSQRSQRSGKSSNMAPSTDRSGASEATTPFNRRSSWRRLDDSKSSKHGITQEHTIDVEAISMDGIPMETRVSASWVTKPKR